MLLVCDERKKKGIFYVGIRRDYNIGKYHPGEVNVGCDMYKYVYSLVLTSERRSRDHFCQMIGAICE